jgi:hypothetical protein
MAGTGSIRKSGRPVKNFREELSLDEVATKNLPPNKVRSTANK